MTDIESTEKLKISRGRITIRIPQNVLNKLETAAVIVGSNLNQFIVQAAVEKATKVMEDDKVIKMSKETSEWFFNLVDNPSPPSISLTNATKSYNSKKIDNEGSNSTLDIDT